VFALECPLPRSANTAGSRPGRFEVGGFSNEVAHGSRGLGMEVPELVGAGPEVIWLGLARGGKQNPLPRCQHVLDFQESRERERNALSP